MSIRIVPAALFFALALAVTHTASPAQAQIKLRYAHVGVAGAPQTRYADEVAHWSRSAPTAASRSRYSRIRSSAASARWSTASSRARSRWATTTSPRSARSCRSSRPSTRLSCIRDAEHAMRATDPRTSAVAAGDQPAAHRGGRHAHRRQPVPGHAPADIEGEGAVA